MKRFLSIIVCLCLVLSLGLMSGCKKTEGAATSDGEYADYIPGSVADVSTEVLEALTSSGTVSSYVFTDEDTLGTGLGGFNNEEFKTIFTEVYGGEIDLRRGEWEGWESRFITDFAAQDAPDIIYGFAKLWPKIANRGMVYSRDELADKGVLGLDHPVLEAGLETADANFTYKDKAYSVGLLGSSCFWCVVNEDLYKQYGVKSPSKYYEEGLWNLDTLAESGNALITAAGLNDSGVRDIFGYYCWDSTVFVRANGQQMVGIDSKTGQLTNNLQKPEVMDALERLRDAFQKGYATKVDTFSQGKIGVIALADGNIHNAIKNATFNWSIIPFPKGKHNTNGQVPGSCNVWMVTTCSENPQGAVNLIIAYLAAINDGTLKSSENSVDNLLKDKPDTLQMMKDGRSKGVNDNMYGVGTLWSAQWDFWNALRHGKQTVPETLQTWGAMFDAQIEQELSYAE